MATKNVYKTVSTKQPTGLVVTRNGGNFTASWKIADKNYEAGQVLRYTVDGGKTWSRVSIATKTTSKQFISNLNFEGYYPFTNKKLYSVIVEVTGTRKKDTKSKTKKGNTKITHYTYTPASARYTYTFTVPSISSASATPSDETENTCTFAWSAANPTGAGNKLQRVQWSTILLRDSNATNGDRAYTETKVEAYSSTSGASGSYTKTETYVPTGNTSYTRWLRCRAQGVNGESPWKYVKQVYAFPFAPIVRNATASYTASGNHMITMRFTAPDSTAHPIKKIDTEWCIAKPAAGMAAPVAGSTWTKGATVNDIRSGDNVVSFPTSDAATDDECLFVRAVSKWEPESTKFRESAPFRVEIGAAGVATLEAPIISSLTASSPTITISASNESDVADSFLVVRYMDASNPNGYDIGIITSSTQQPLTITVPAWSSSSPPKIGVYAVVGTARLDTSSGYNRYTITNIVMKSAMVTQGGTIPAAPGNVSLSQTDIAGTIRVAWDWTWTTATGAELSWADHADAWESTDEPETYEVRNVTAEAWNISGLATGIKWYVRVRLFTGIDDDITYGAYSETAMIDLSSAPSVPALSVSDGVIPEKGDVTASWVYVTTDGTQQVSAEIAEVTVVNNANVYTEIARTETAQFVDLNAAEIGWASGETHTIVVRVASASGHMSEWSNPASVSVADPLTCTISQTSLVDEIITVDSSSRTVKSLKAMPMTITVTGAGAYGQTTVMIVRAADYQAGRPDESVFMGYEGETIALVTQTGEAQITIDNDMLIGHLDDEAQYRIIATIQDGLGQTASASIDFEVHWTHQALMPEGTVEIDEDNAIAILTATAPTGTAQGDVCDIYRLSVDKPELIIRDAAWGTEYVDPYPAIGEYGGYRFVFRSGNGDYITAETEDNGKQFAWVDVMEDFDSNYNIIDFGNGSVMLQYNVDLSNSWSKDFQQTKYLGGSIQGDWNPAVSRTASFSSVAVTVDDSETIEAMRHLATWAGICHVRTKDGSSYAADVQATEKYAVGNGHNLASFDLKITRVDPEGYDGMTLTEWQAAHQEDEEE